LLNSGREKRVVWVDQRQFCIFLLTIGQKPRNGWKLVLNSFVAKYQTQTRSRDPKMTPLFNAIVFALVMGMPAHAQQAATVIVQNDRGGAIGERLLSINRANANGTRFELRGRICYSSCTLYLGADHLCIDADTVFGFHGPSRHGHPLPPKEFEHWSQVMAAQYRAPLQDWFLRTARHRIMGYYRLKGAQLIAMGYPQC
jgi:hypothetical protein